MLLFYVAQTILIKIYSFNIAESHIEFGKHFQERSLNVKVVISGILPQDGMLVCQQNYH